ncbi:MAG: TIGR00725 family protein [Protaetiibacter sp.]
MRKTTIGVIGNASRPGTALPAGVLEAAEEIGRETARRGAVLVNGGTSGVMEASSRGAQAEGGLTVGFLPYHDFESGNAHLDLVFPTGMGTMRNIITARVCDSIIMIGGGVGTLNELTVAYDTGTPVVILAGSGGWSDRIRDVLIEGVWLDERRVVPLTFADSAADAVEQALVRGRTEPRADGRLRAFTGAGGQ